MGTQEARNRQVVERYWDAHFHRRWDELPAFFAPDAHYTDVGVDPNGATGGDDIVRRLKIGIEPLSDYLHFPRHMVAEGDLVVTEHVERWVFHTGEVIDHPFASVMEVHDGLITRWHDYSHLNNIFDNAPAWWLERIAAAGAPPDATPPDAPAPPPPGLTR